MNTILRKYGTSAFVDFSLFDPTGANLLTSASFQYGDLIIKKDNSTETSAVFLPQDDGSGYYLNLSASELTCKRLKIFIQDTSNPKVFLDTSMVVETYGDTNSEHPDLLTFSNSVDGVDVLTLMENLLAQIRGTINKTGNRLDFLRQDGSTVSYSLSANNTQRLEI